MLSRLWLQNVGSWLEAGHLVLLISMVTSMSPPQT